MIDERNSEVFDDEAAIEPTQSTPKTPIVKLADARQKQAIEEHSDGSGEDDAKSDASLPILIGVPETTEEKPVEKSVTEPIELDIGESYDQLPVEVAPPVEEFVEVVDDIPRQRAPSDVSSSSKVSSVIDVPKPHENINNEPADALPEVIPESTKIENATEPVLVEPVLVEAEPKEEILNEIPKEELPKEENKIESEEPTKEKPSIEELPIAVPKHELPEEEVPKDETTKTPF